jgi:hypothetical protein
MAATLKYTVKPPQFRRPPLEQRFEGEENGICFFPADYCLSALLVSAILFV